MLGKKKKKKKDYRGEEGGKNLPKLCFLIFGWLQRYVSGQSESRKD
jgi:hypothetical protein